MPKNVDICTIKSSFIAYIFLARVLKTQLKTLRLSSIAWTHDALVVTLDLKFHYRSSMFRYK